MRKFALTAVLALTALALAAPSAMAVNSLLKFEASVVGKAGTKKKPRAVALKIRPFYDNLDADRDAPFAWTEATVHLPKELVFNSTRFAKCSPAQAATASGRAGACKKAEIGKVNAKGFALGLVEPLKVGLYNGTQKDTVVMYLQGDNPVIIDHVIVGKLKKVSGKYGWELTFSIPADLQQPAPGAWATALDFKTQVNARSVKKGKKTYPFVGLTGCSGTLNFGFSTKNSDGTTSKVELTSACKK